MQGATPEADIRPVELSEVVEALHRVLEAKPFARSPRSSGFLAYVVTETLAGRGERLSERTVASGAMHRDGDFDGRGDAAVRVQATRVRNGLEDYYAGDGAEDPIRIVLPRGSYRPVFRRSDLPVRADARVPGVVVVLLTASGDEPAQVFARSMSESLLQNLAAHPGIRVVGPIEARTDGPRAAEISGVSAILTGQVMVRDEQLSLTVELVDPETEEMLWSTQEAASVGSLDRFEAEEQWSRQIASSVGDLSGVVIRNEVGRMPTSSPHLELAARLAYYAFMYNETTLLLAEAIARIDAALDAGIRNAPLLAMRGALANCMSEDPFADAGTELDSAESFAREALGLDANSAHAHLVISWPTLVRGNVHAAVEHVETAVRLAPFQPTYLASAGVMLIASGEWDRGSDLIREARRLNPHVAGPSHGWLAFVHLVKEEYGRALVEASLMPSDDEHVWVSLVRAIALAGLGYDDQARVEAARVRRNRPDLASDVGGFLASYLRLTDEQLTRLVGLFPE